MAKCTLCEQEMSDSVSCVLVKVEDKYGEAEDPIPWDGGDDQAACHDCATPPGGLHHPGCDAEICPFCECQVISCGCLEEDEDLLEKACETLDQPTSKTKDQENPFN